MEEVGQADDLLRLLHEVDRALGRLSAHAFGRCEVCGEDVEDAGPMSKPFRPARPDRMISRSWFCAARHEHHRQLAPA
jgi:hypothetical protein